MLVRPAYGDVVAVLTGRVASGLGDLSQWMVRYSLVYEQATGTRLYPGSLNVVLEAPWSMRRPDVRLEASEVGVGMGFVRCHVDRFGCWILRTDRNNSGRGSHGLDVLEVVAAVHLRTVLHVGDGDEVSLWLVRRTDPSPWRL